LSCVIDSHTHIFPAKIAEKASGNIGAFYDIPMRFDGTLETLMKLGELNHIDRFLVHSVATAAAQVEQINTFIAESVEVHPDKLIGFATLHPDMEHIGDEVDRAVSLGLKGIKLHPDFQRFNLDDKAAYPIYEAAQDRIPILTHTGDYRHNYSNPARIPVILKDFPRLKIICAHLGGWSQWKEAEH
jgi:predicted TIM-barrel fold metal-dependent hydrolase